MKAAVINGFGEVPQYLDFPAPIAAAGQTVIQVKAAVLENFDKGTASGKHYSSKDLFPSFPAIPGITGVGTTPEGKLVMFRDPQPPYGSYAEQSVAGVIIPVPEDISPAKATAIPPSAITSLLPLKYTAKLQPGETVLIHGATGVSGRIAVQVARLLGAGRVIGTGRNKASLEIVKQLGADEVIDLNQPEEQLEAAFASLGSINVVIDFLWGRPAELLINSFMPKEAGFARREIRYVQIGTKAGFDITLAGAALRTSGLQLMGMGRMDFAIVLEELQYIWQLIQDDKLYMEIEEAPLADIAAAWQRNDLAGKRLVIVP
ncbi:zinc-binding alcohol dehydrogenase family protein [Chitinophaga sp. sic0106]|uniref:quinone oxidoreductase family protein n=1 Tax=Chitinophaga sp. sic0106 TaxID=2854785 RepID=UPI001C48D9B5|nr:zinc-binding alcohol dehydrogenase family protein [Chitinophaga sp. sic0106]MBV7530538.1 zinc-binding alcohol dehydrogenase family protein [Chitinophaga sp. sic0106]